MSFYKTLNYTKISEIGYASQSTIPIVDFSKKDENNCLKKEKRWYNKSMNEFFKQHQTGVKLKFQSRVFDPVIFSDDVPEIYVVSDFPYKQHAMLLDSIFEKALGRSVRFRYIYNYKFKATTKEAETSIERFVFENGIDFTKYIPEGSRILALGRGLYGLTKTTDLQTEAFYDLNWTDQRIYHPETKSWIYPVDGLFKYFSFEEKRILDNFEWDFFKRQLKSCITEPVPAFRVPPLKRVFLDDPNTILSEYIGKDIEVAADLETYGFRFWEDIICMTLSFDGHTGYYLPWEKIDLEILNKFFKGKFIIGANFKFDCKFLRHRGVTNAHIDFDTLNAGHCINEMRSNSLETHGWLYTLYGGHEQPLTKYKYDHPKVAHSYWLLPRDMLAKYAADDSSICFQVYKKQKELLAKDPALSRYYYEEVVPSLNMFIDIELEGLPIDWDRVRSLTIEFKARAEVLEKEIFELAGHSFNISSGPDLGLVLEKDLELPDLGARAKSKVPGVIGYYLTGKDQLESWSGLGFIVADKLLAHRSLSTFIDTFLGSEKDGTAYWGLQHNGNIYPTYSVMLATSGRLKCHGPNLQQAPKHGELATLYREIFKTPSVDTLLTDTDYSGFQLRIAAVMSGDPKLCEVFSERDGDVHSLTAIEIFHPGWTIDQFVALKKEEPYATERQTGKTSNFRFIFGGSPYAFSKDVIEKTWTRAACMSFIREKKIKFSGDPFLDVSTFIYESFFETYAGLTPWHEASHQEAMTTGCVRTVHGAHRLLPQLTYIGVDSFKKDVTEWLNIAKNSSVQNFEVVCIMRAMRKSTARFKDLGLKSRLFFGMIHDSVLKFVYKDEADVVKVIMHEEFEKDYPEYKKIIMECESQYADPSSETEKTYWGHGKTW